ncbi:MAG TPA: hypothetical protein VKD72_22250 [Gemmataceae bacterium]|nr:hypothetical protein [Gemmataceae bacterium]
MKAFSLARWGAALWLLGTCAASPVRAEPGWSYNWTTTTPLVGSGGSGVSILPASGSGSGSSDIVAANLAVISSAPATTPDPVNGGWNLTLHLTDNASGNSGTFLFTGQFSGTVSASSSSVDNVFNDPKVQTLSLGAHLYTATIGLYTPPGLTGTTLKGAIGANLALSDVPGSGPPPGPPPSPPPPPPSPPPVVKSPEPSGLVLALMGVSSLGLGWWNGRRSRRTALALA